MNQENAGNGCGGVPAPLCGLRVLLLDNDTTSSSQIAQQLEQYSYRVTTSELAEVALSILQERADCFDLVVANVNIPEMDCFDFIKSVVLIKDSPIILMYSELNKDMMEEAMTTGACFFLKKPVSSKNLKNLWQHVYRKSKHKSVDNADEEDDSQGVKGEVDMDENRFHEHEHENEQIGDSDQAENIGVNECLVDGKRLTNSTKLRPKRSVSAQNDDELGGSKRRRTEGHERTIVATSHLQKQGEQPPVTKLNGVTSLAKDRSNIVETSSNANSWHGMEFLCTTPSPQPRFNTFEPQGKRPKQLETSPELLEFRALTDFSPFPAAFLKLFQQTDATEKPSVNQKLDFTTDLASSSSCSLNRKQQGRN